MTSDLSQLSTDRNRVLVLVIGEALVALVGAVAGAYLLLRRLLREIGRITTTAASIEDGDLDRRLGDQGTDDEVGQLAETFDSMLDRLQAAMVDQRRLLSDVSHQLRTPLTVARGHLEVLALQPTTDILEVRESVNVVVEELDHMRALVERLLLLGRALEPDFLQVERLDLRTFLSDLFDSARVLADRQWSLAPVPDRVLEVDVAKLRGALSTSSTTPSEPRRHLMRSRFGRLKSQMTARWSSRSKIPGAASRLSSWTAFWRGSVAWEVPTVKEVAWDSLS